jgi:hypothetical protein
MRARGDPLRDGNTWELRALLAFSVCIMALCTR